jgi:glutamate racemase
MLQKNIDTVVLGCTHYPFVIPLIQKIVGENVRVIDPAPSVAKQAKRLLEARDTLNQSVENGRVQFSTSGDVHRVESALKKLLGIKASVQLASWSDDSRSLACEKTD